MANPLGRISGQLLKDNLTRNGNDLSFDTDLLHLNVNNRYIGANTNLPNRPLTVSGKTLTTNLIVDNSLSMPDITISSNEIASDSILNLVASNYVNANHVKTDGISINDNIVSTLNTNQILSIEPDGDGTLEVFSDINITGNLYTPYNITLGGSIRFGSDDQDTVSFAADIDSNIIPDQDNLYSLGSNPSLGGKRWEGVYPSLLNGQDITLLGISSGNINQVLRPGNIWFVATNGSNTNVGDHQQGPFATIEKALSEAASGDTIYIYPGNYVENFPLVVPAGVTIKGMGIRSVTVSPTVATQYQNAFLLNGETTVSDLTVKDFYYDSVNNTGYAFSFAPGFTVTTRSPYIQNVTVITQGSVTSPTDPRGFNSGDAGRGALIDGAQANYTTKEASMLFHSVTMITPGVTSLVMTNGVRVEWLNSFVYFADIGLYATQGTGRLDQDNLTLRYGAEIRSIGSANVYGNYGAMVDGANTLMYLINHNFAYIGAGKDVTNDPSLNVEANETVELNNGRIYYQSVDNKGNFAVGDPFKISFEDGSASINGVTTSATGITNINFSQPGYETLINSSLVLTGNIKFEGNNLNSLAGAINFSAATGEVLLNSNTDITDNLTITGNFNVDGTLTVGNQIIDVVTFNAPVEFNFRPQSPTLKLGESGKVWNQVYVESAQVDDTTTLTNNQITTITTDTDLILQSNGISEIQVPSNNVEIDNNLTVAGDSNLGSTSLSLITIAGLIDLTGDYTQVGDYTQTGNREVSGTLTVTSDVYFDDINFVNNKITTTIGNNDLELLAAGTGKVVFNENLRIVNDATFGTLVTAGLTNAGTISSDIFFNNNISINDNVILTTVGNSDLNLQAAGTGIVFFPTDPVLIDFNLTVNDTSNFKNTVINGSLIHNGTTSQTGNVTNHTGNFDLIGNLTVNGTNAWFKDVRIVNNQIYTSLSNSDLILKADGTGIIDLNDYVQLGLNLTVSGLATTNTISNSLTITSDIFDNGNIEIYDNIISTTVGNDNLILSGNGTGGPTLERIKFNSNTISTDSNNYNITLSIPAGNLDLNTTTALKLPVGTTANRATLTQAELRFNTTDSLFRGFSTARVSFNGIYSDNLLTKVLAHPTNNTLNFTNNNIQTAVFSSTGLNALAVQVDNVNINNNVISTTALDTNIDFSPNGTGRVVIGDIALANNEILNLNLTQPIILQNTNNGYIKFSGTGGIVIPVGDNSTRPLNPETGDMRWNTELSTAEVFNGIEYQTLSGSGGDLLNAEEVQEETNLWALVLG